MRPIILGYFFSNNYDGNKYISFQDLHAPRVVIFPNFRLICIGPMSGRYCYNHGVRYINLVCSFSTKTMGIINIHFGHHVGRSPSTELSHEFCAGSARCSSAFGLSFYYSRKPLPIKHFVIINYYLIIPFHFRYMMMS